MKTVIHYKKMNHLKSASAFLYTSYHISKHPFGPKYLPCLVKSEKDPKKEGSPGVTQAVQQGGKQVEIKIASEPLYSLTNPSWVTRGPNNQWQTLHEAGEDADFVSDSLCVAVISLHLLNLFLEESSERDWEHKKWALFWSYLIQSSHYIRGPCWCFLFLCFHQMKCALQKKNPSQWI